MSGNWPEPTTCPTCGTTAVEFPKAWRECDMQNSSDRLPDFIYPASVEPSEKARRVVDALGTNDDLGTIAGFHRMEMEEAGHLLDDALQWLKSADHEFNCPRLRDDYDCTCGLSDLRARIVEWLTRASP